LVRFDASNLQLLATTSRSSQRRKDVSAYVPLTTTWSIICVEIPSLPTSSAWVAGGIITKALRYITGRTVASSRGMRSMEYMTYLLVRNSARSFFATTHSLSSLIFHPPGA